MTTLLQPWRDFGFVQLMCLKERLVITTDSRLKSVCHLMIIGSNNKLHKSRPAPRFLTLDKSIGGTLTKQI